MSLIYFMFFIYGKSILFIRYKFEYLQTDIKYISNSTISTHTPTTLSTHRSNQIWVYKFCWYDSFCISCFFFQKILKGVLLLLLKWIFGIYFKPRTRVSCGVLKIMLLLRRNLFIENHSFNFNSFGREKKFQIIKKNIYYSCFCKQIITKNVFVLRNLNNSKHYFKIYCFLNICK